VADSKGDVHQNGNQIEKSESGGIGKLLN
jgi:hypothetical protein